MQTPPQRHACGERDEVAINPDIYLAFDLAFWLQINLILRITIMPLSGIVLLCEQVGLLEHAAIFFSLAAWRVCVVWSSLFQLILAIQPLGLNYNFSHRDPQLKVT